MPKIVNDQFIILLIMLQVSFWLRLIRPHLLNK